MYHRIDPPPSASFTTSLMARISDEDSEAGSDAMSRHLADAVEHAVERLDPQPEERVLVISGCGWTARRLRARGNHVTTAGDGFSVGREPEGLPIPDGAFDAVISTFDLTFARRPERLAAELARVCRVGGRVALTTWTPASTMREIYELVSRYATADALPAACDSFSLGETRRLVELFGDHFDLGFELATSYYRARSGRQACEDLRREFPPLRTLLAELDEEVAESFRREVETFHERHRTGLGVLIPREYLVTVGRRRD